MREGDVGGRCILVEVVTAEVLEIEVCYFVVELAPRTDAGGLDEIRYVRAKKILGETLSPGLSSAFILREFRDIGIGVRRVDDGHDELLEWESKGVSGGRRRRPRTMSKVAAA